MNRRIGGGWKYVNEKTGIFFDDANNIVEVWKELMERVVEGTVKPREWMEDYGSIQPARLRIFTEMMRKQLNYPYPFEEEEEDVEDDFDEEEEGESS